MLVRAGNLFSNTYNSLDSMTSNPQDYEEWRKKLREELKKEVLAEIRKELKRESKTGKIKLKTSPAVPSHNVKVPVEPPQAKETILVSMLPVLKIALHALRYANARISRDRWVEVIGLLAGRFNEKQNALYVEDAYPMGHGDAIYAQIKDNTRYVQAYRALTKKGRFICGWYHSHPSYGLFISQEDWGTQFRYQQLWSRSVALVMDPYEINGTGLGFGLFRADLHSQKWYGVPFQLREAVDPHLMPALLELFRSVIDGKIKLG